MAADRVALGPQDLIIQYERRGVPRSCL